MHRLNELAARLTPAQLREVEDFAEFLAARGQNCSTNQKRSTTATDRINVDALRGLCAGMGGDKSDKELIREAWDAVVDEALK